MQWWWRRWAVAAAAVAGYECGDAEYDCARAAAAGGGGARAEAAAMRRPPPPQSRVMATAQWGRWRHSVAPGVWFLLGGGGYLTRRPAPRLSTCSFRAILLGAELLMHPEVGVVVQRSPARWLPNS